MNAMTVIQPFAHLIAIGVKPIENRQQQCRFRGELAIHAGKNRSWLDEGELAAYPDMAFGAIVAVVRVVACLPKRDDPDDRERWKWATYSDLFDHEHAEGPWCLVLEDLLRLVTPVPCRGAQGLWSLPPDVETQVRAQIAGRAA